LELNPEEEKFERKVEFYKKKLAEKQRAATVGAASSTSTGNPVEDAHRLCSALEKTGLTGGCKVRVLSSRIDVRIDTTPSEARKMCTMIVNMMSDYTHSFGGQWQLRILSLYSERNALALCPL
jgi:hypothetical protein